MGHAIFIEDGVETKNLIEKNLVVSVHASYSLLQSDQQPACFYVTNPDNQLNENVAVGSAAHGFWFNLPEAPLGSYASEPACP